MCIVLRMLILSGIPPLLWYLVPIACLEIGIDLPTKVFLGFK